MASLARAYNSALLRRPMLAQCATGAVLFGTGDMISQQVVEKRGLKSHDWARTGRVMFYGGAVFGPIFTKWYQLLNKIQFPNAAKAAICRVVIDQSIQAPTHVAIFFTCMALLEGNSFSDAKERLNKVFQPTLIRNWSVFIPTQIINMSIVPHHLRFFVVSVVGLCWNTYLNVVNAQQRTAAIKEELVVLK